MFLKRLIMIFLAFTGGAAVAAGTFAFLLVIGVVPRMLWRFGFGRRPGVKSGRNRLRDRVIGIVEMTIVFGVVWGSAVSLWPQEAGKRICDILGTLIAPGALSAAGHILVAAGGLGAGIFVGSIAVSLAEIIDTFPVLFRRFGLEGPIPHKLGKRAGPKLEWLLLAMALGKLVGALWQALSS